MFYGETIKDTRLLFIDSWRKFQQKQVLEPLEQQLVEVMCDHPEYHNLLEQDTTRLQATQFFPELGETNPFLHMGLHLLIREQVSLDMPRGIADIYQQLLIKYTAKCEVEHHIMQPLGEMLWQAQRYQTSPDDAKYLQACMMLLHA